MHSVKFAELFLYSHWPSVRSLSAMQKLDAFLFPSPRRRHKRSGVSLLDIFEKQSHFFASWSDPFPSPPRESTQRILPVTLSKGKLILHQIVCHFSLSSKCWDGMRPSRAFYRAKDSLLDFYSSTLCVKRFAALYRSHAAAAAVARCWQPSESLQALQLKPPR